ncbi:MAG: DNA polymerase III subunit alpha, partial [Planctomycetaceae bacterium]|nr:DNA polymerase III subunit alpha [Planctomycetaceae bacterium]
AYLKAHYPVEFMAALLSCEMESTERISEHIDDARRMQIPVLPPDINRSVVEFGFVDGQITFGMGALKGVGEAALQAIVDERIANGPFRDVFDLAERVDPKVLTKSTLETLTKAGVLDTLPGTRAQQFEVVERAVQSSISKHRDRARGQKSLFDDDGADDADGGTALISLPDVPDWTHSVKLAFEKEAIGFYLTSHPLAQHSRRLERFAVNTNSELAEMDDGGSVLLGGMISSIKLATSKKPSRNGNSRYANFDLDDPSGIVRCIAWPDDYSRYEEVIKTENVVFVAGRVDRRGREPNVIVNRILTLDQADKEFTAQVAIKFERGLHTNNDVERVRSILQRFPGSTDVILVVDSFTDEGRPETAVKRTEAQEPAAVGAVNRLRYILAASSECKVSVGPEFLRELSDAVGDTHFDLKAAKQRRR